MTLKVFTQFSRLAEEGRLHAYEQFVHNHPFGNYFQSPCYFNFIEKTDGYSPILIIAFEKTGEIAGTLLGCFQSNGTGLKAYLSRRVVVSGGPLLPSEPERAEEVGNLLLAELRRIAANSAIYIEFRNFFDTSGFREIWEKHAFQYKPHLNILLDIDSEEEVKKRMSRSRRKELKTSMEEGVEIVEPTNEDDILAFYAILRKLYKEKVKKPLPGPDFFLNFWKLKAGKFFLVKLNGKVEGGIVCPVFKNKIIYEWYICGNEGLMKGVHVNAMATWAPIEYGLKNGLAQFDFLGAGRPGDNYGVREFKSRFGGQEVCYGRYESVVNKPLYLTGKFAISFFKKLKWSGLSLI